MKNSRWSNTGGTLVRPNVSGDIEILKYLGAYPYLTIDDLAALTRRSYTAMANRTNKLKRLPNNFIKVAPAQAENARLYQYTSQALQLSAAGVARLKEIGFETTAPAPHRHFVHSLTQSQTAASFEIGARAKGLDFYQLRDVVFKLGDRKVIPDGTIGIGFPNDLWKFVAFETDCATETLSASAHDRQTIERKISGYLAVLGQGLYETQWKIPNLTILFTTTTKHRLDNMRDLLRSMTADFVNCFGFMVFPTILSNAKQPENKSWAVDAVTMQHR